MTAPHDPATAKAYNRTKLLITVSSSLLSLLFLLLLLLSGWSSLLEQLATSLTPHPLMAFLLFVLAVGLLEGILTVPFAFASGFVLEHRYGLSNQTFPRWLCEQAKGYLVSLPVVLLVLVTIFLCLTHFGHLWWLPVAGALTLLSVILARLAPVLIMPLFYKFTPLGDETLKGRILDLSSRAGVSVAGIFTFDLSKNTRKANAGFTGIGRTRRIILGDTLLSEFPAEEVETIFAHELGHYVHRHIRNGIFIGILLTFAGLFITAQLYERSLALFGFAQITQLAAMPLLGLWLSAFGIVTAPLSNALSRHQERQADSYAVRTTGGKEAFISALRRLGAMNLADTAPHPLVEFLFYSHPSIGRRIQAVESQ